MLLAKTTLLGAIALAGVLFAEAQTSEQVSFPRNTATTNSPQSGPATTKDLLAANPPVASNSVSPSEPLWSVEGPSPFSLPSREPASTRYAVPADRPELEMPVVLNTPSQQKSVAWGGLAKGALTFLGVEHGFRLMTEPTTRHELASHPFFISYAEAVGNLHGWSDGDEFYVNWVGHPMQGAVAGYIWQSNDRAYKDVEFGRNRRYWKSKLRGATFSYLYSVQFEIGPISEASIGFIQANPPEMGFVDHAITPAMGLAWTIGEDFMDRDVIQRFESRFSNPYLRILLRGGLNPSRSFANVMNGKVPWHRDDRPGVFAKGEMASYRPAVKNAEQQRITASPGVAPFEFHLDTSFRQYLGNNGGGTCIGGSGAAMFRINPEWQIMGEVGGCKMLGFAQDVSGDSLDYLVGPRWTPQGDSKWHPHFEVLVGGTKVTEEIVDRTLEAQLKAVPKTGPDDIVRYTEYTTWNDSNGFAVRAGAGVTYKINSAFALQVADFKYQHSWADPIGGLNYRNSIQFSGGLILKMGTW
jgi:hypothetical protein